MSAPTYRSSLIVGITLMVIGLIAVIVVFVPFGSGVENRPVWLNLLTLAAPVGLAVSVYGTVRRSRAEQRAIAIATGEISESSS